MMKTEQAAKLEGMSWDWRAATCLLLDIARGEDVVPEKAAVRIIRSHGYAVLDHGTPRLTAEGLDYLRKVFA